VAPCGGTLAFLWPGGSGPWLVQTFGRLSEVLAGGSHSLRNGLGDSVASGGRGTGYFDLNNRAAFFSDVGGVGDVHFNLDGWLAFDRLFNWHGRSVSVALAIINVPK
jgi:hypothetical protein